MGLEGSGGNGKLVGRRVTPLQTHKRSQSFPDKKIEEDEVVYSAEVSNRVKLDEGHLNGCPKMEAHNSLKQEILLLEKRLQDQFEDRRALEKALGYKFSPMDETTQVSMSKPAAELIKEISVLELEVVHLEQYLLSLYRKAFDEKLSVKSPSITPRARRSEISRPDAFSKKENSGVQSGLPALENPWKERKETGVGKPLLDSSVHRCHSSLSHRSGFSIKSSPPAERGSKSFRLFHSQPLSMMECAQNASSNIISLAEHLGTRISDHIPETPNRLSEDMVKCMASIYCKLADPPLPNHGLSSPNSSSTDACSPQDHCDMWSPTYKNDASFDVRLDNPFHVEGLKEFSGPYSTMLEVSRIYRDNKKLGDIEILLQNFRSLISRLEQVDPRKMNHDEKLAFWINVHNSLVMHAYLAYGIPQNSVKRLFLLLKAAYNVGGHTISADTMQSSILGCRMSRPGQWLRLLLSSKTKFKIGDERRAYSINRQEPLLHFALCTGSHSDPALRVYTPKRIFQELEGAKEEYFRGTFGVRTKDNKIVLPKMVESYMKDADLCAPALTAIILRTLPEYVRKNVKSHKLGKSRKHIEWIPHNFTFRYLVSKEMVK